MARVSYAVVYGVLSFIVALTVAWVVSAQSNFFYKVWHEYGVIGEGIERYGPVNRYKQGFETTSLQERNAIFAAINVAIHDGGQGLEQISYKGDNRSSQKLLRQPEIVHLQDVANLIDVVRLVAVVCFIAWLAITLLFFRKRFVFPKIQYQALGLAGVLGIVALVVFFIGPEQVFNTLHVWVFPDDHQWFFYYQDSLMSTMMMAPLLFGYIAVVLLVLAGVFFILINVLLQFIIANVKAG